MYILLRSAKLAVEKGIAQGASETYFTKLSDHIMQSLLDALHEVVLDLLFCFFFFINYFGSEIV